MIAVRIGRSYNPRLGAHLGCKSLPRALMTSFFVHCSAVRLQFTLSVLILAALAFFPVSAQNSEPSAAMRGVIRDSQGKPLAGVTVRLQTKEGLGEQATVTDSQGIYAFTALGGGVYTIAAEMNGFEKAIVRSIFLESKESKTIDLSLVTAKVSTEQPLSIAAPRFFDQPQFTVSGVTDTTSLGGHGSDTIVRTRNALAREALSLTSGMNSSSASLAAINSLRQNVESEPRNAEANCRLGQALIASGQPNEAIPYLERATELEPADYEASYGLALANERAGNYDRALALAQPLLAHNDDSRLHHLLGNIDEKLGNPLEAVRQYQRAAELDPSETYLFDWGSELLLHHAPEPALEVFGNGHRRFPRSVRMLIGLGAAWFARDAYDQAVERVCEASDLSPNDEAPYLFLGEMQIAQPAQSEESLEKLHRFVTLKPDNAAANYYYAVGLLKRRSAAREAASITEIQSMLEKVIRLDPHFSAAYLQLGILHSEQGHLAQAILEYQQAIEFASPQSTSLLAEAHYRLAQAYREIGETAKSKAELELYHQLTVQATQNAERERRETQQFVYTLRDQPPNQKP